MLTKMSLKPVISRKCSSSTGELAAPAVHIGAKPRRGVGAQGPGRDRGFQIAVAVHVILLPERGRYTQVY